MSESACAVLSGGEEKDEVRTPMDLAGGRKGLCVRPSYKK